MQEGPAGGGAAVKKLLGFLSDLRISNKIVIPFVAILLVAVVTTAPLASSWAGSLIENSARNRVEGSRRAVDTALEAWGNEVESRAYVAAFQVHLAGIEGISPAPAREDLLSTLEDANEKQNLDYSILTFPDEEPIATGHFPAPPAGDVEEGTRMVNSSNGWALQSSIQVYMTSYGTNATLLTGRYVTSGLLDRMQTAAGEQMNVALSQGDKVIGTSGDLGNSFSCNGCHERQGVSISSFAAGQAKVTNVDMLGSRYFLVHSPASRGGEQIGTYSLSYPLANVAAAKADARNIIYGGGALLFLLIVGAGVLISRSITRRLGRLAEVSQDIAAGNLSRKIEQSGSDEVGQLSRSLAAMTQGLATRLQELGLLHQVSLTAGSTLELDTVLETILESAVKVLDADGGSIMLLDQAGESLDVRVARGRSASDTIARTSGLDEGPAGWVARNRRPLLLPDDLEDQQGEQIMTQPESLSGVSVPIATRGSLLGVLNLSITAPGRKFDRHTVTFANTLANQTAMAIEKARHHEELNFLYSGLIRALASTIDAKDRYTAGHSERVAHYAQTLGARLNLTGSDLKGLETAAYLHDVGKIGVRDAVLTKPGRLTPIETQVVHTHPAIGATILKEIEFPWPVANGVHSHHERWDGYGYPDGLSGTDIPQYGRILALADSLDAMTSNRPHRKARSMEEAEREILRCSGTQFDPSVVEAFQSCSREMEDIISSARTAFPTSHAAEIQEN